MASHETRHDVYGIKMKGIGVIIPILKITRVVLESCDKIVLEIHQYRSGMTTLDVGQH